MSYSREVYDAASAELQRRRREAEGAAEALRERVFRKYPRAAALERQMAQAAPQVAQAVLNGGDPTETVRRIERDNLAAQEELRQILAAAGEKARDFSPQYTCPLCGDTGYVGREMCSCFRALLADGAGKQLSRITGMKPARFEEMDLRYYSDLPDAERGESPREHMADVLDYCRCYGENFHAQAESLLLFGTTGTGKTHTALSIARLAAERGFSVVYGPVQQLLHRVEREHFGRAEGDAEDTMIACDLLILDDLGTEMTTQFTIAALYQVVNTRLMEGRATIVSTNLPVGELDRRYSAQIASRLLGAYTLYKFSGKDIRMLQKNMARPTEDMNR